ncbi:MarR family winged helix-turn-helix transcriptional regulator [Solwaraspora sp. WMMB335]|uniref:MarR family winged helix-turn-helix transcriptional regulator n=1 Tax=Solwaraspora sp. WMMB335 TaxID=3404118 RepID=UPI003B93A5BC
MTRRDELIAQIMAAHHRFQLLFASDRSDPLFESQLTVPQLKILLLLYLHGAASGQQLSRANGVRLATMTGIVDRLVAQHLVRRREDPHDRRVRLVELTRDGQELIDRIVTAGAERQARLLGRLDLAGLRTVSAASELLLQAAEADAAEGGGMDTTCGWPTDRSHPVGPALRQVESTGGE